MSNWYKWQLTKYKKATALTNEISHLFLEIKLCDQNKFNI